MLYALTDFLVVIGVAIAVWRMWPIIGDDRTLYAAWGLGIFAIAAAIGTVRFGTGRIEELAALHSGASAFAGFMGVAFVSVACLHSLTGLRSVLVRVVGVVSLFCMGVLFASDAITVDIIAIVYVLIAASAILAALVRNPRSSPALLWLAAWLLLIFASTAIGGSREETTLGIANWHIYHALLGLWAVLVGEAVRASVSRHA